jgi:hypothetical protein
LEIRLAMLWVSLVYVDKQTSFITKLKGCKAGEFGFETVGLSYNGRPTLNRTIVASTIAKDYYLGEFGISPRPSNFTVSNYNSSSMRDPVSFA